MNPASTDRFTLPLVLAALLLGNPALGAVAACDGDTRSGVAPVELHIPSDRWLIAQLREDGSDWVMVAARGDWRLESDTAPSRLAVEHLALPGALFANVRVDARSWSGGSMKKPIVQWACVPWQPGLGADVNLMWGGAWLVAMEGAPAQSGASARYRAQALTAFAHAAEHSGDLEKQATASHTIGYLLQREGRRDAAAAAFDQAAAFWQTAQQPGQALAARFHAAQARLNGGAVAAAADALDALYRTPELRRWPFLSGWVENDRCLALHELTHWDQAERCFEQLARRYHAQGQLRESALARCNRVAALAGARRWTEAQAASSLCMSEQNANGGINGRAQALHLRGWVRLQQGELRAGIDDLGAALKLLETSGDGPMSWQVRSLLAGAWLVLDEEPRAVAMLQTGLTEFPAARDRATHARLIHELGRIQRWEQAPEAIATLTSARDQYHALGWTRLQREVECELATAGWAPPPAACELGQARADLSAGRTQAVLERALAADTGGDWASILAWLELAIDATRAGADPAPVEALLRSLVERSQSLDDDNELTRRVRAAVQLELAGAAAALVVDGNRGALAPAALALVRAAGPPVSSSRTLLYGVASFPPGTGARRSAPDPLDQHPAPLPPGVAELSYLRFGSRAYWLLARRDQIQALPAPSEAAAREISQRWRDAVELGTDLTDAGRVGVAIADQLGLADLLADDDRLWLTHFNGPMADLPWSALPRRDAEPLARLGYAALGASLAIVAVSGSVDAATALQPVAIDGLAALDPTDLPVALVGSRTESADLTQLAQSHRLPLQLWSLADLSAHRAHLAPATLLLLSGHAAADRALGESSALRLGANGETQWGALDLETWPAPPTLLILGACESAAGPERRYFGDFGLASAAARSGAAWVLGHRWPVDDQAAAELHRAFVAAVLDGAAPGESLRRAQTALAESRRFAHPRHWAGALLIHTNRSDPVRGIAPQPD